MPRNQASTKDSTRSRIREPRKYKVVFHNDDFTTCEFVIFVLHTVFRKSIEEAEEIMLKVHHEGKGIAGIYSLDIAASKSRKAIDLARDEGFPLRITVEPLHSPQDDIPF